jgi:threonine synthase
MSRAPAVATPSPAMDISVPSNFERLLYEATGRDGDAVRSVYDSYKQAGEAALPETAIGRLGCVGITAATVSNADTLAEMARFESETGWLICPHTAVGTFRARQLPRSDIATVVLATAAAAKFPETVKDATSLDAPLPHRCGALLERGEVFDRLPADLSAVRGAIEAKIQMVP